MSEGSEFQIIKQFFTHQSASQWKSQGVGDDCALIDIGQNRIAVTSDMMAIGTHFLPNARPEDVGYKALAVNLSDLAAAGASPRAFFLSIALPERDDHWLERFSSAMMSLANETGCALLGGDTTRTALVDGKRAPLTISITAIGELPQALGTTRQGAQVGDDIWVSGTVGDAYSVLQHRWGHWQLMPDAYETLALRMDRPSPRNALGIALLGRINACADISDGLLQDLRHILERSGVGATLDWEKVPLSVGVKSLPIRAQQQAALAGGDDYELVFTAPKAMAHEVLEAGIRTGVRLSRIGQIVEKTISSQALVVRAHDHSLIDMSEFGFDHFRE